MDPATQSPEEPLDFKENTKGLLELYPVEEYGKDIRNCILILLAFFHVGGDGDSIATHTGLSRKFVRPRVKRLRENGVFEGRKILNIEWMDESEHQHMQLLLDAMVANGHLTRKVAPPEEPLAGLFQYYAVPETPEKVEPIWYVPPPEPTPQVEPRKRGIWGKNG
jgi:hypothetical protein